MLLENQAEFGTDRVMFYYSSPNAYTQKGTVNNEMQICHNPVSNVAQKLKIFLLPWKTKVFWKEWFDVLALFQCVEKSWI